MSGESCTFGSGQDDLSEETKSNRLRDKMLSGEPTSEQPSDRILTRESRNIINKSEDDNAESISSSDDSQPQPSENESENTSNSDKKLKAARETGELETEGKNAKKPPFGRTFDSYCDLLNHYSNYIIITDSGFLLTEHTCATAITVIY